MKQVAIFEDGKSGRGLKAKLIKRGNKRVLIEFLKYNDEIKEYELTTEWFKLFIPKWGRNRKNRKHNNKRKQASYIHEATNLFYSDYYQKNEYIKEFKDNFSTEYFNSIYK